MSMLTSTVVPAQDLEGELAARWDALLDDAPARNAFLSRSYVQACARTRETPVRVCVFRDAKGQAQAFMPFELDGLQARLLGSAQPAGGSFADYFGLIASPGFRITPEALLRACGLNSLLFTHLDSSQDRYGLQGDQPARGLRIRAAEGEDFIEALFKRDKKFAADTERRRNKLERDHGPLRFAVESVDSGTLDWLIDLKVAQYQRTAQRNHPFSRRRDAQLLKHLAAQSDPRCMPRLTALYCGDQRIAAHFGLQCHDTLSYWFPVYTPDLHSYSPGRLLLWETLRHAPSLGIRCVDRGEGDTQAKRDFANEEHVYLRGYYSRTTPSAMMDRALNSLRWRLQSLKSAKPQA
ncbi:GNAT family N-acetyltransferase [Viridibacterium curvum]|uniref:GNAT family N-acetyltransferase n=1 Tax=Viridibacterium curvum TaxID=1101404 RepID=A0ABP9QEP2_9RHOO